MSSSHEIETRLRETAEELLKQKKVSLVLGYEKASLPFRTTPFFLTRAEDVGRLAWNPFCTMNLSVYLPRLLKACGDARGARTAPPPTVGVIVKACDTRSVLTLLQERQVRRENLVLIGVECPGMVDRRKAEDAMGAHEALGAGEDAQRNIRVVVEDGTEITLRREEVTSDACVECRFPVPPIHDIMIGTPPAEQPTHEGRERTADSDAMPIDARWARFREVFATCIRCNACRQACPMCYCATCIFDQGRPRWIGAGTDASDVAIYHLTRALHLAGRCTECGACERACPLGIDVRLLERKLCEEVEDLYGYRSGEAIDATPVLSSFSMDDPQDFVTEP